MARRVLILLLTGYHRLVSPLLPPACRFHPSCSMYAAEALGRHGLRQGLLLAIRRLSRCHPYSDGGYDPVPGADERSSAAVGL